MHWKYTNAFSISFEHDYYPPPLVDCGLDIPLFSLVPTEGTQAKFSRSGWLAKPFPNGILVLAEKTIDGQGQETFRPIPAADEVFSFWVLLNNVEAIKHTKPFDAPLPLASGLSRLFFFDNLSPTDLGSDKFRLTVTPKATASNMASRVPLNFLYKASNAQSQSVEVRPLVSGSPVGSQVNFNPVSRDVYLQLEARTYQLTPKPVGTQETIVAVSEQTDSKIFGIVRIFNTITLPILEKHRKYNVQFAKP